jgi:hypothetical protein
MEGSEVYPDLIVTFVMGMLSSVATPLSLTLFDEEGNPFPGLHLR